MARGRRGVAETERKRRRGAPYVSFWRDVSLSRRSRHAVAVGDGEAMLLLPGLPWSVGDIELTPKPLMVMAVGGKRLDGGVRPCQISSPRDDEIQAPEMHVCAWDPANVVVSHPRPGLERAKAPTWRANCQCFEQTPASKFVIDAR